MRDECTKAVLANARRIHRLFTERRPRGVLGRAHATLLTRDAGAWPTRQQSPTAAAAAAARGGDAAKHVRLARAASSK